MKKDTINYFMVGSFVLSALLLLLFMLFRITGQGGGTENYYTDFYNITGLKNGAAVTYGGYQIGQVDDVKPVFSNNRTKYKVKLMIKAGWKISQDSVAQIIMPGVISDKQIEISEGTSQLKLDPGDAIHSKESVDVMALVNSIGNELDSFIPDMARDVSQLLNNLNTSAEHLAEIVNEKNRNHINNLFKNADDASNNLSRLALGFERVNNQLNEVLKHSKNILADNDQDIRYSVTELRNSMKVVSENIHSIMYNLESSTRNMNEFTRQLRDNPGVIIGSKPPVDKAEQHR